MKTPHSFAQKVYNICIVALLLFLPWSILVSVFFTYQIGVRGFSFIKEGLLLGALLSLFYLLFQKYKETKVLPFKLGWLDYLIGAYIVSMVFVTIFTTGIRGLIFGGRYDFVFLIAFWIVYHGSQFLYKNLDEYIKYFLYSAGIMLFVSGLLKFPLNEELLLFFGFSANVSAWDFGGAPPIFHGIEGANIRRFQGLLDGPNTMGTFLIIFTGIFTFFIRKYKDWYFVAGIIISVLILMLLYTYSRSAMIGFAGGVIIALCGGIGFLYKNYKKQMLALGLILLGGIWMITIKYAGNSESIIGREGSTKGHAERMIVGLKRFSEHPFGQGLGSAGPAYRHVLQLQEFDRSHVEEQDRFYIPESWYIQQFIEGGFLAGILFLLISAIIFFRLFSFHSIFAGMFAGVGATNLFLHTYESSVIALTLFILIGLILAKNIYKYPQK